MIEIKKAGTFDFSAVFENDNHISREMLDKKITDGEVFIAQLDGMFLGHLRYSLFWDEIPFINMLVIDKQVRRRGVGTLLVLEWEKEMLDMGFNKVMTSTLECESAQHFYRKLGYRDLGKFMPFENEYELILGKNL